MESNKIECSGIEHWSVIKLWVAEKCKPSERIRDGHGEAVVLKKNTYKWAKCVIESYAVSHNNTNNKDWRNDKDARRKSSLTKYLPLTLFVRVRKVVWGFTVRGSWRPNRTEILWPQTYGRQCCVFLVLWCSTGGPEATLLGDGFLYGILSASSPDLNSSGPFGLMWLSLHITSPTGCNSTRSSNSTELYNRSTPTRSWNRMFNRHQAEITVMQFTGHSLPVHQSMSVPWEFFSSSHFISQFPPTRFPLITAIRMCHLLPVHHLGMAFLAGSKGQNITNYLRRSKEYSRWETGQVDPQW